MSVSQAEREELERVFWENNPDHRPDVFSLPNIFNKMAEAPKFLNDIAPFEKFVHGTVLELGGGQLWASCLIKHRHPEVTVIGSDIGASAVAAAPMWENILRAKLDRTLVCTSYDVPVDDDSIDFVFVFQAAHHFGEQEKTLVELMRILKPGGRAVYLSEPTCSRLTYKAALARVNRIRPEVYEDYIIRSEILRSARKLGFRTSVHFDSGVDKRGLGARLYYRGLAMAPFLRAVAPTGATLLFEKEG